MTNNKKTVLGRIKTHLFSSTRMNAMLNYATIIMGFIGGYMVSEGTGLDVAIGIVLFGVACGIVAGLSNN